MHKATPSQLTLLQAQTLELQSQLEQLKLENKALHKQVQLTSQYSQQVAQQFQEYKRDSRERMDGLGQLVGRMERQIGVLRDIGRLAEERGVELEGLLRVAREENGRLVAQLTEKQNFINGYLKKL